MSISLHKTADYNLNKLVIHVCGNHFCNVCSCNATIDRVNSYKYLGVVFDLNMRWSEHVEFLKNKLRKYIFAFKKLKEVLTQKELKTVYFAYVQSHLTFGIIAFGGAYKSVLQPLFIVQKLILKVAFDRPNFYPTKNLFSELRVLTI